MVRVLIEAGAHVNVSTKQGDTPLHLAAMDIEHGPNVCVELMKAGASYRAKTSLGWTPLHSAMYSDNEEVARLLIRAGADPTEENLRGVAAKDMSGRCEPHIVDSLVRPPATLASSRYAPLRKA